MREILFRGKVIDDYIEEDLRGKWVEGDLVYGSLKHKRFAYICPIIDDPDYHADIPVIPETVDQFIGLLDRDGKKIFEGDIIRYGDITGIINYSTGCYCVKTNKPDWRSRNNPAIDIVLNEYPNEIRVIGNIHDNPELLEVNQ